MTAIADWHAQARDAAGRVVAAITPDSWQAGTPLLFSSAAIFSRNINPGDLPFSML